MRKMILMAIAAAAASAGCESRAQEGGSATQRSYQVGGFDRVEVAGPYDVRVRTGASPSVSASGPQELIERLVVEVKDGRLQIHPRKERGGFNWNSNRGTATVDVTVPMLRAAAIAGSGEVRVDNISGDRFDGSVAGSGDLHLDSLQVQALKLSIAGSGDVRVAAGQAGNADYSIAGSGDIDAARVRAGTAAVSIAGSGNINGHAAETAAVSIIGSGNVELTGGAKCTVSKAGSGSVRCS